MKFYSTLPILCTFYILFAFIQLSRGTDNQQLLHDNILYIEQIDSSLNRNKLTPDVYKQKLTAFYHSSISQSDTTKTIISLIDLADLNRWEGNYEACFDKLWLANELSISNNDSIRIIRVKRNLGILYDIFNQDSLALQYLHSSLRQAKKIEDANLLEKSEIIHSFYNLAIHYQNNHQYELALNYLDSCKQHKGSQRETPFVDANIGSILLAQGKTKLASKQLLKAYKRLSKINSRYQVIVLSYIGDLKATINQKDSAVFYYEKSLSKLEELNAHAEVKPELLNKLSGIYHSKKQYEKAYRYLQESKSISDQLFSTINERNQKLFKIRNRFKEELQQKEAHISRQSNLISKKQKALTNLIIATGIAVLLFLLILTYVSFHTKMKKLQLTQRLEKDKNDAVLETKNKELTQQALISIEKEKAVQDLLSEIKKHSPADHASLKNKYVSTSSKMWDDFNLRFMKLNKNFYKNLQTKHPELTPSELKHCALIKLNFDNKEMSQILNISLQSVHTSRYRIKKKIGLAQEENLAGYIGKL